MKAHVGWLAILLGVVMTACNGEDQAIAGMFDVGGGRQLYLACQGEGSPTVVMESGGAGHSATWERIQPDVAESTRACAYDRAGTGRSITVAPNGTTQAIAEELHALLAKAGVDPPYVVVGHSLGGIVVRQFATLYPDDIVGMVLVDTSHGDQRARFQAAVTPEEWQKYGSPNTETDFLFPEGTDLRGPDLADISLVVLSAGQVRGDVPADVAVRLDEVRLGMHRELLGLSTNATHVIAEESDHAIPSNQPDLVVDAIRQVVGNGSNANQPG